MASLPPLPTFKPVFKRERPMTGYETNPEIVKRKILDYYENLTGTSFDYGRPGIRGIKGKIYSRDKYHSGDRDDLEMDFKNESSLDIYLSDITLDSISKFLVRNKESGVRELEKIKININALQTSGVRVLFKDEPVIEEIIDKLVESIPEINSAIKSFHLGIPSLIQTGKDDFYKKYLKYKNKYLELKKKLSK